MKQLSKSERKAFQDFMHPTEVLRWVGRSQRATIRNRLLIAGLILVWLASSAVSGIFINAATFDGLGLLGFALTLVFLYIVWAVARDNFIVTGDYYAVTNLRVLIFHVRANKVEVASIGISGNLQLNVDYVDANKQYANLVFSNSTVNTSLVFRRVADVPLIEALVLELVAARSS